MVETISQEGRFVNRGDPANVDWELGDFTIDYGWHELDLSSIVPAGVSSVLCTTVMFNTISGKHYAFRTKGNTNTNNESLINNQIASKVQAHDIIVHPDRDGKIEYFIDEDGWIALTLTVKGWWR